MRGKWTREDGERLRAWRKARGLTRDGLALALGVGGGTLHRWETAQVEPRGELLALAHDLLTCDPASRRMRWPAAFDAALARWVDERVAWAEIAARLGVSEAAARKRAWLLDL